MAKHKTHYEDCDVLVVGGGMAGTGATFEARHWGRDLKIICVEKANIDRSGAVAEGLDAINGYMGMQWGENQPEDHVSHGLMLPKQSTQPPSILLRLSILLLNTFHSEEDESHSISN